MSTRGDVDRTSIYKRIAEETGHTYSEIERAVKSQFRFVAHVMKQDKLDSVRLPFFGLFHPKKSAVKRRNQTTDE